MKLLSKTLFACYLLLLAWLVLFKFSFTLSAAFAQQTRRLNLIPLANNPREMLYNVVVFVPFGLLLNVNLKRTNP